MIKFNKKIECVTVIDVLVVYKLQLSITVNQLTSFADITANISLFIRSYFLVTWLSRTAAVPANSVTL